MQAHLTRRLILDTSADSEKEENMVEWLREVMVVDSAAAVDLLIIMWIMTGGDACRLHQQVVQNVPGYQSVGGSEHSVQRPAETGQQVSATKLFKVRVF